MVTPQRFVLFAMALFIAGCAQQAVREAPPRPARDSIERYAIEGRVAIKRGNESRQAGIQWQHEATRDNIELSGPLGQQAARLTRDANGATLETSSRERVQAADWSSLAERVLGVALPLDNLTHWLTADVASSNGAQEAQIERDPLGRPLHVSVNGWQIDYRAYESDLPEALPTLIHLRRDDIDVRLKIDSWQIDPPR